MQRGSIHLNCLRKSAWGFVVALWITASHAAVENVPPPTAIPIGIVNLEKVTADIMQALRSQVEARLAQYHAEFKEYEERLRQENQELEDLQTAQAQDEAQVEALLAKKQTFEKRVLSIQRKAEERRQALGDAHAHVIENLNTTLAEVVKEIGAEMHLALIIPQSAVVYWHVNLDISDAVKERLMAKLELNKELLALNLDD